MTNKSDRQDGDGLYMPSYGKLPWDQLGRDVMEAIMGRRDQFKFTAEGYPGHEMTGINFNSLSRIVDRYRLATPPTHDGAEGAEPNARLMLLLDLPPAEQFDIATKLAENVGYVLASDTYSASSKPTPDAMREEAKRLLGRAKIQSYPPKILDDCIAFLMRFLSAPVPPVDGATQTMNEALARHYNIHPVRGDREAIARTNLIRDSIQRVYDEMCVKFSGVHSDDETDSWLLNLHASLKLLSLPVQPVAPRLHQDTLDRLAMLNISEEEVYEVLKKHLPTDMIDGIWQEIKEAGK